MKEKIVILGSGPAGLSAAIYAARAGLSPLVVEGMQPGGQLAQTAEIENFPGFPGQISGQDLMVAMRIQAERCGASFLMDEAVGADFSAGKKKLSLMVNGELECDALVVCTGASTRWTGIPGETRLRGRGVSACAVCDGAFFKGRDVVVIGGGDTAISDAIYLARICSSVTVVHRRDSLRASRALADRVFALEKVKFAWNCVPVEFKGGDRLESVEVASADGARREIPCSGAFVAIGNVPNTSLFEGLLEIENGYLKTAGTKTSVPGVFAAGDVADPLYKQAVIAAGTGAMAALEAERYLA